MATYEQGRPAVQPMTRLSATREGYFKVSIEGVTDKDMYECSKCGSLVLLTALNLHSNFHVRAKEIRIG